jgi:hypothetical protein
MGAAAAVVRRGAHGLKIFALARPIRNRLLRARATAVHGPLRVDVYDSISWESLVVPSELVNRMSLPDTCALVARLGSFGMLTSTRKFVCVEGTF